MSAHFLVELRCVASRHLWCVIYIVIRFGVWCKEAMLFVCVAFCMALCKRELCFWWYDDMLKKKLLVIYALRVFARPKKRIIMELKQKFNESECTCIVHCCCERTRWLSGLVGEIIFVSGFCVVIGQPANVCVFCMLKRMKEPIYREHKSRGTESRRFYDEIVSILTFTLWPASFLIAVAVAIQSIIHLFPSIPVFFSAVFCRNFAINSNRFSVVHTQKKSF